MIIQQRIIADGFGHSYRLQLPDDEPVPVPIKPKEFWDPYFTWQFVCGLRVSPENWRGIVHRYGGVTASLQDRDADLRKLASTLLLQGRIKLYPVAHLAPSAESIEPVRIDAGKGESYRIIPASMLLVNPHQEVMQFHEKQDAEHFLKSVSLSAEQLGAIGGATGAKNAKGNDALIEALLTGKLAIVKVRLDVSTSAKSESSSPEPASQGTGTRPASLGPHAGGDQASNTQKTYKTQDSSAIAALNDANPRSIKDNLEYGGLIYKDTKTGQYGYTGPIKGSDQGVNPFDAEIPPGTELVGDYHTHADYSIVDRETGAAIRTSNPLKDDFNSDNFSSTDITGIAAVGKDKEGYKGYLGTPSGAFKEYDPATKMTRVLK